MVSWLWDRYRVWWACCPDLNHLLLVVVLFFLTKHTHTTISLSYMFFWGGERESFHWWLVYYCPSSLHRLSEKKKTFSIVCSLWFSLLFFYCDLFGEKKRDLPRVDTLARRLITTENCEIVANRAGNKVGHVSRSLLRRSARGNDAPIRLEKEVTTTMMMMTTVSCSSSPSSLRFAFTWRATMVTYPSPPVHGGLSLF